MPNPENIIKHQFKKGEVANPNGRPKKYITTLREQGYKLAEINDTIQVMLSMSAEDVKKVMDNPEATILEKTIAAAMQKSLKNGSLYSIETLLTRAFGKPKESVDVRSVNVIWHEERSDEANNKTDQST